MQLSRRSRLGVRNACRALTLAIAALPAANAFQSPPVPEFTNPGPVLAFTTFFDGCAAEGCGCGIPPELLKDTAGAPIPYVALNVQNTPIHDGPLTRPLPSDSEQKGMYDNGLNCGRWIKITFLEDCVGFGNDAHSEPPELCGVNPNADNPLQNYAPDQWTGTVVYAVVADSCQDNNYWCRNDLYHLDLQRDLVLGACNGATDCINARQVSWEFVDARIETGLQLPETLKFAWHCRANLPWYQPLIVHNLPNGISGVMAGGFAATRNTDNGQQWVVPTAALQLEGTDVPTQAVEVEVLDIDGKSYGVYAIEMDAAKLQADCKTGQWASSAAVISAPVAEDKPEAVAPAPSPEPMPEPVPTPETPAELPAEPVSMPAPEPTEVPIEAEEPSVAPTDVAEPSTDAKVPASSPSIEETPKEMPAAAPVAAASPEGIPYEPAAPEAALEPVDEGMEGADPTKMPAMAPAEATGGCAPLWRQCGGTGHAGPDCCAGENVCQRKNQFYSQCLRAEDVQDLGTVLEVEEPTVVDTSGCGALWDQCGGLHHLGALCCAGPTTCKFKNQWYSQCRPDDEL